VYTFETVDAPGADVTAGFNNTFMNNSGVIGQIYIGTDGNIHYAIRNGNTWQVLEVPGAFFTVGLGPNNAGRVALDYGSADGLLHVAVWQEGRPLQYVPDAPPNPLGEHYDYAGANNLNERGIATGWTFLPWTDPELAYGLLQDTRTGAYQLLIYPGAMWTNGQSTNDRGTTVGAYATFTYEWHAFTWDGHTFTNIDVPGGTNQLAGSINNEGYIAGNYTDASGATLGFIRDPMGQVTDLMVPQALHTVPNTITDNLKISGSYQAQDGTWHGFVATPARRP